MSDIYFDGVAEPFSATVYGTSKGYVRLGVLWADLCEAVPEIEMGKLTVLDVGGGMGQIAARLARLGHSVTLVDPSEDMLGRARDIASREGLENVTLVHSSAQDLSQYVTDAFDLVLCHAVLEWVVSPDELIRAVSTFVRSSGALSLMFYNQNAAVLKAVFRGDFETYASAEAARAAERASPGLEDESVLSGARPLTTETVTRLLREHNLTVTHRAGIRIFHDHISALEEDRLPALLELEKNYRHAEPFASLAQHVHLVCRNTV